MSVKVNSIENHQDGTFRVDVSLGGMYRRFDSMADARKWLQLMKVTGCIEDLIVNVKEYVIMAKRQFVYDSCYVM